MSSFIYKILFDKQKPLYYNSITVLLLKDAPPVGLEPYNFPMEKKSTPI